MVTIIGFTLNLNNPTINVLPTFNNHQPVVNAVSEYLESEFNDHTDGWKSPKPGCSWCPRRPGRPPSPQLVARYAAATCAIFETLALKTQKRTQKP
uniref:Uncharacterized protein n=1 Tax=Mycena chlorophos TaxID=658473 RepID=A0ABQ0L6B8_MYCCL|nr:predicted protein [Mycena chlorophos]